VTMRLALVSAYPAIDGQINGGVEGVTYNLVQGLKKRDDIEVSIITPGNKDTKENRNGVTVYSYKQAPLPGFLSYWSIDRMKIHKLLTEIKPDITHFQGLLGWSIGYQKPYIATMHGVVEKDVLFKGSVATIVRHKILKIVEGYARRKAKNLIVINKYIEDLFADSFRGRINRISNPVLNDYFEIKNTPDNENILYIGRISELKNILGILEIFKELHRNEPDAVLNLVGSVEDETYLKQCQSYIRDNDLTESVIFHGALDISNIKEIYSKASLLILMSKQEVAPMVISEAMAAGVPVVASDICGIKYMIEHGITGYKFNSDDKNLIVDSMTELLRNKELRNNITEHAKANAIKTYGIDNVVNETLLAYEDVLSITCRKGD